MPLLSSLLFDSNVIRMRGDIDVEPRVFAEGLLFWKIRSPQFHFTALDALRRGAKFVVLRDGDDEEHELPEHAPYAVVDDVNRTYARVCSHLAGDAHRKLTLIGVTGTKGKTTVCHLVESALRSAGVKTGLISSLVNRMPGWSQPAVNTTPEPLALHGFLAELHRRGGTHAVIEISSIGIAEERLLGLQFDALAFTNLGSDHLEYHGGRDHYIAAKQRIFTETEFHRSSSTLCAFNADDPVGRELAASSAGHVVTFSLSDAAVAFDGGGIAMRISGRELHSPLIGRHNAENLLAAAVIVNHVLQSDDAALHLRNAGPLPGRLEKLATPIGVDVYIDYAHTPESVEAALAAVRQVAGSRRVIGVIGCSGNSDKRKRPLVARAAIDGADVTILTSDNPGNEHAAGILMDMLRGVRGATADRLRTIVDRRTAVAAAIEAALPDGVVVLMGKGTENFQLIQGLKVPYSDHRAAMDVLRDLAAAGVSEPPRAPSAESPRL